MSFSSKDAEKDMRKLKEEVYNLLSSGGFEDRLSELSTYSDIRILNVLLKFLYSTEYQIKDNAIKVIGIVAKRLADKDPEIVRRIIRRLMLNVTEESGGIGWGSPSAMGEIMAMNKQMAEEFHHILVSYSLEGDENYLDAPELQKDVISGLKRLGSVFPQYVENVKHLLD